MAKKKTERQKAIDAADGWFSKWVRLSNADKDGWVACYTCGKKYRWDKGRSINAGHFMVRGKMKTRWHEDNVRPQCSGCNMRSGEQHIFGQNLDKEREGLAEEMRILSHQVAKWTVAEIREIADEYEGRVRRLLKD